MKDTQYFGISDQDLQQAAELLKQGKTVVFPTETVYGLGADARNTGAVSEIFSAKGRPSDNPLIVHIAHREQVAELVKEIPEKAKILMDAFWPGPLTLIFRKSDSIPKSVTGGLDTVAVRMPQNAVAAKLLEYAGIPVAAPSANLSGKPSPTTFRYVKQDMDGRVDGIIDGGDCAVGVESTVLDISGERPVLYRPGAVTVEMLEEKIGPVRIVSHVKQGEQPKSPGLKYKHYAPNTPVKLLHGSQKECTDFINEQSKTASVGVLVFDEFAGFSDRVKTISLGSINSPETAAQRLFTALRDMDRENVSVIYAPEIPDKGVWRAVRNRLYRAAGETIVSVSEKYWKKVLFVCTGNTCRSPMAEAVMRARLTELRKDAEVFSRGLFANGLPMSYNAVLALRDMGIEPMEHRSANITSEDIASSDLILTMTENHKAMLLAAAPEESGKIMTLSEWAKESADVSDPYGGDFEEYSRCLNQINDYIVKGLNLYAHKFSDCGK